MSNETTTPKKSILTDAMEKVTAKKAKNDSDEPILPVSDEVAAKRLLKKAGIALVGTVAAVTAVIVIANRLKTEDETTDEVNPED